MLMMLLKCKNYTVIAMKIKVKFKDTLLKGNDYNWKKLK